MASFTRKVLVFIVLGAIVLPASLRSEQMVDGIAAVVNENVITLSQVRKEVDPTERQYRDIYNGVELVEKIKEARLSALKSLIERELIIQDFKKQGFFMPDNVIEERVEFLVRTQYDGDRSALLKTLQANGVSMANFRDEIRNQFIVGAMRNKNVQSAVLVSPYRIEQYYQDNIRQFMQPNQVKLWAIFMKRGIFMEKRKNAKGEDEDVDPQLLQMEEIYQKVETGSDFANLAESYSEAPQRSSGGDMGWVSESTLRPELAKVAFKLRPGESTKIVEVEEGYYILRVEEIKKATVVPLADVRDQIEQTLMLEEKQKLQQVWLDGLRSKAFIKMMF